MNAPFYIAKRYLFAKKSHNAINIISGISVIAVAICTMALIVILSAFNGLENLFTSFFTSFDPDLKITAVKGKSFSFDEYAEKLKSHPDVADFSEIIEENALLLYDNRQHIGIVKGVSENFKQTSGLDSMMREGEFTLHDGKYPYAIMGYGVAYYLGVGLSFIHPVIIYTPKRKAEITYDPNEAFNKRYIFPKGIFAIEPDIDSKYIIVPIEFARELFDYPNEVTSIDVQLKNGADVKNAQKSIQQLIGDKYVIKNRFQQKEFFYKVMKSEKWAIFFILTFIFIIASFNITGSLTMLIIEKKRDMFTLKSMGASPNFIRKIFFLEGWMISIIGGLLGIILGFVICHLQSQYGFLKLNGSGSFIVSAYPIKMAASDFINVFLSVIFIGMIAAWYPVMYITKKHLLL